MRLSTYFDRGTTRAAVLHGDVPLDANKLLAQFYAGKETRRPVLFGDAVAAAIHRELLAEVLNYAIQIDAIEQCRCTEEVRSLSPIPRPNRILAIGRNYADHARELGNAVPEDPIVFLKASTSVIGPGETIEIPEWVGRVDYEAELLVVLGKGGKNIPEADAMGHVVGYAIFNDVTARERQRAAQEKRHPWFLAKSLDTFGALGPYLVTADEVPDPHGLRITLTVNGETKQDGTTASMIYPIPALIAFLSRWFAIRAGIG